MKTIIAKLFVMLTLGVSLTSCKKDEIKVGNTPSQYGNTYVTVHIIKTNSNKNRLFLVTDPSKIGEASDPSVGWNWSDDPTDTIRSYTYQIDENIGFRNIRIQQRQSIPPWVNYYMQLNPGNTYYYD